MSALASSSRDALEPRPEERYSTPYRHPYHLGLYLAVNAIPRSFAVIDGPDCLYRKGEWVHGKHDLGSTLLDVYGNHRIVSTLMHAEALIKTQGDEIARRLRRVNRNAEAELALVCSMPHVQIIGTQYDKIIADLEPELRIPVFEVPSRALDGDWIDGYVETLDVIARRMDVADAKPIPGKVAVIGYLMDRGEADHLANVAEMERMLGALGLEVASVWLSGRPYEHLRAAREAELLIAFPMGRRAARSLGQRTGARVLEVDVPFGFGRTRRMLRQVARATGTEDAAERFERAELGRLIPRLEWVIPRYLVGRRLGFSGDPCLFPGLIQLAGDLGLRVLHLSAPARRPGFLPALDEEFGPVPATLYAPPEATLLRHLGEVARDGLDIMVGNSLACQMLDSRVPSLVFGFPSFERHMFFESPYLGFNGAMWFIQELSARTTANAGGHSAPT